MMSFVYLSIGYFLGTLVTFGLMYTGYQIGEREKDELNEEL